MRPSTETAFEFRSGEDRHRVVEMFWEVPELEGLPRHYVGYHTFIIPKDWKERLKLALEARGITFVMSSVIPSGRMPPRYSL